MGTVISIVNYYATAPPLIFIRARIASNTSLSESSVKPPLAIPLVC